jgi:hypothetical protein
MPGATAGRSSTRSMPASPSTGPTPRSTTSPATPGSGSGSAPSTATSPPRRRRLGRSRPTRSAGSPNGRTKRWTPATRGGVLRLPARVGKLHAADRMLSDVVASGPGAFPRLGPRPRRAQRGHQRAAPPGPGGGRARCQTPEDLVPNSLKKCQDRR